MKLANALSTVNRKAAVVVREWRIALGERPMELLKKYAEAVERYHLWYYNTQVHNQIRFLGRPTMKSVSDMWNYQEIIHELKAPLVVEFGTLYGGSALYFKTILAQLHHDYRVLTVDVDHRLVDDEIRNDPHIELMTTRSTHPSVAVRISQLREKYPGPVFFILDSDHSEQNVLEELKLLRGLTWSGDYVIVEDSNVNGHPVVPGWGPGPFEASEAYFKEYPEDYVRDEAREKKFGFTYATKGFLIRR